MVGRIIYVVRDARPLAFQLQTSIAAQWHEFPFAVNDSPSRPNLPTQQRGCLKQRRIVDIAGDKLDTTIRDEWVKAAEIGRICHCVRIVSSALKFFGFRG